VFGRSASTPLLKAPQKPRNVPAVSAMSVRFDVDMGWSPQLGKFGV
jgi:hypothetical protein